MEELGNHVNKHDPTMSIPYVIDAAEGKYIRTITSHLPSSLPSCNLLYLLPYSCLWSTRTRVIEICSISAVKIDLFTIPVNLSSLFSHCIDTVLVCLFVCLFVWSCVGKINNQLVTLGVEGELWTRSLKFLLADVKWIVAWAAKHCNR